ncbi:hypothetical protein [Corynebacterium freiburgense]|uniref:hypothetical protein n=1 Tax=Corynebacterium freiburgense TaxID=556548 RepID=UPI00047E981E|nr:hypothetical protein [Corynebacterium freiburgense]WJZ02900.1 hypothetical protein CFREI_08110 [Corynebacterium freiburgense]
MTQDLPSLGMDFPHWQDAVEAAIGSGNLEVTGEVRGGQLVQFTDNSGAQINILAVEPFATWAGFTSTTAALAHIQMVNDVVALCDLVTQDGKVQASITCNLAQGPLLVDEPTLQWEQLALSALAVQTQNYADSAAFQSEHGSEPQPMLVSQGAMLIASGSGAAAPDASAALTGIVQEATYRTNKLTGQRFIHATLEAPSFLDVCLPDGELPQKGSIIAGTVMLTGSILPPAGCGDSCGSCGGGCGH